MAKRNLEVQIKLAWWYPVYFWTLAAFCKLFGTQPDYERFERITAKAMRITTKQ